MKVYKSANSPKVIVEFENEKEAFQVLDGIEITSIANTGSEVDDLNEHETREGNEDFGYDNCMKMVEFVDHLRMMTKDFTP